MSSRTMVLCVSNVTSVGSQCQEGQDEDKRNQAVAKPSEVSSSILLTNLDHVFKCYRNWAA